MVGSKQIRFLDVLSVENSVVFRQFYNSFSRLGRTDRNLENQISEQMEAILNYKTNTQQKM